MAGRLFQKEVIVIQIFGICGCWTIHCVETPPGDFGGNLSGFSAVGYIVIFNKFADSLSVLISANLLASVEA